MPAWQDKWESDDGSVTLYHGDALKILPTLESGIIGAVVTDIPYNISQEHGGLREIDYGEWDKNFDWRPAIEAIVSICDAWCVWCAPLQLSGIIERFNKEGMSRPLVWVKPNPTVMNGQHHWLHGNDLCAAGKRRNVPFLLNCHRGWWNCLPPANRLHPTQKPIAIIRDQVLAYNGTICDPYMGSATTGVACIRTGRKFIGIELEPTAPDRPDYFGIAVQRCKDELARFPLWEKPTPSPKQMNLLELQEAV